jgi:hypothetical protein
MDSTYLHIADEPQLFIDNVLIESTQGACLKTEYRRIDEVDRLMVERVWLAQWPSDRGAC